MTRKVTPLAGLSLVRLVAAPILAAGLAWVLRFPEALADVLIVTSGLPVAVNVFILAVEYRQNERLASQAVFWTTVLSALSLSVWLAIVSS